MTLNTITPEPSRVENVRLQAEKRSTALATLRDLRDQARAEIERLIAFLDASDSYIMTEREEAVDDVPCDTDELEVSEGDDEDDGDSEPSLGSIERHPPDGQNWTATRPPGPTAAPRIWRTSTTAPNLTKTASRLLAGRPAVCWAASWTASRMTATGRATSRC